VVYTASWGLSVLVYAENVLWCQVDDRVGVLVASGSVLYPTRSMIMLDLLEVNNSQGT
jgi:hypothetical protein